MKRRSSQLLTGSNPGKPDFFRLSFRNCISCVNNCEDLLYIYKLVLFHFILDILLSFAKLITNTENAKAPFTAELAVGPVIILKRFSP